MDIVKWLSNVKYQPEGQILVNDHPEFGVFNIADIRGWSYLQSTLGTHDAAIFMDQVGKFIEEAIEDKINYIKEEGVYVPKFGKHETDFNEKLQRPNTELSEKLRVEIDDLSGKIERLSAFIESDAFHKIHSQQIKLFPIQLSSMSKYLLCLQLRLKPGNGIVPLPDANQEEAENV
jgi:hypothetical protein